jgi:hypothetical protein
MQGAHARPGCARGARGKDLAGREDNLILNRTSGCGRAALRGQWERLADHGPADARGGVGR